jgi:uncharacterized protein (DUF111 family)
MKTLYLDCGMGAAGDMLTAALLDLLPDREAAVAELNAIGVPHVVYGCETVRRCGICGAHMSVRVDGVEESEAMHHHAHEHCHEHEHTHTHAHTGMDRIARIVRDHLNLPEEVRADVLAVYDSIARAESHAHGVGVADIHFHEAGTMDALADITAAALLKHFVTRFGEMPVMTTEAIGYGMGTKEFDAANCLRAFWGQSSGQ